MPEVNDLRGRRFGRLRALEEVHPIRNGKAYWKCECECGLIATVRGTKLTSGAIVSCGCWRADPAVRRAARHKVDPARRVEIAALGAKASSGGRPRGVTMPCGWCSVQLTAREMRAHFTTCAKRPA